MYKIVLILLLTLASYAKDITIGNKYQKSGEWIVELEPLSNLTVNGITLFNGDNDFNLTHKSISKRSTVYVLIDSSYPMREAYGKGIKPLIKSLYKNKKNNQKWVISEFDTDLRVVYNEFNGTSQSLDKSLNNIKIKGQRTELWKNTLEAIEFLNNIGDSSKKVLVICSDGKAEDKAYKIENAIEAATKNHITIVSLGYRDLGTEKTDYIQNMERIANDTHGKFWNADKKHQLSKNFIKEFSSFVGDSSTNIIETRLPRDAVKSTISGKRNFVMTVAHTLGSTELNFTLDVLKISGGTSPNSSTDETIWDKYIYYIIGVVLLLLLLLLFLLTQKRDEFDSIISDVDGGDSMINDIMDDEPYSPIKEAPSYVAYFESLGGTKHFVYNLPSTIGSSSDIVIEGNFISRKHAIIDFKDGYFFIIDTDSKNRLFVNDKEVVKEQIKHDDKVSFGPYDTIFKIRMS